MRRPAARLILAPGSLGVLLVILALMPSLLSADSLLNMQSAVELALFACGTNLLVGYGGLVSFGQGAFYGTGAYVIALMWLHWQTSFWLGFAAAPFIGAFLALLVGLIALRTRQLYFALLTLAFSQLFYVIALQQTNFTGGANGVFGELVPGFLLDPTHAYYFTLIVVVIALAALWRVTRSPFGITLRAIRENRERAEALGVNVFRHQLMAFVFAGFFCALAGTLFVVNNQSANPDLLNWTESGYPIFMSVIGGQFVFLGPALGALIYEQGRDVVLAHFSDWQLVFGLMLLGILLFAPDGLSGLLIRGYRWLRSGRRPGARERTPGGGRITTDGESA
ncbi:MAG TPA: branched-chain amino acid ABC transporter permease [Solirubrobacteraceae bacterium]|nr:branched-chain amino acid ABC transporter permease [Solirubrobacteraceae bacterium]